jgi:5,10-methylenetetrahydromethanopterin reductase
VTEVVQPTYPELGCYTLPGHVSDPERIFREPVEAEQTGLGSVWISERFGTKDVSVLSGVAAARTTRIGLVAGLAGQLGVHHPLRMASYASTMAQIAPGRFALGLGRGMDLLADATGTPRVTFAYLDAYISVLRRLWRGERVNEDSPAGRLHGVRLDTTLDTPPPIIVGAMGDETLRWAGAHCDGVLLNSLWSAPAVERSVRLVREGAERAGRDPASVKVWTILVTACEVPEETVLLTVIRRMNTYMYFPWMVNGIVRANGWDPAAAEHVVQRLKQIDAEAVPSGPTGDEHTARDLAALREMRAAYPEEWIADGNAVGDRDTCCRATLARFEAGADGVLFHGSAPMDLAPLLARWPSYRPKGLD